eukprot:scaffold154619_cov32-Tisochrysis_lutea.AAC.4
MTSTSGGPRAAHRRSTPAAGRAQAAPRSWSDAPPSQPSSRCTTGSDPHGLPLAMRSSQRSSIGSSS